ncbi:MAG TPA: 3-isopropylmalate dehydratase small subunit [Pyrinomonadaceae bacterium]|nr:3-isopropylmalate dehydratase small subunit [Pyrinomonadaceae bacterium]HMP64131.1 3-isopropylmalate dehydratase small subunit [Pyrinomonadaceae bacterium]
MTPFVKHTGRAVAIGLANIDTDQIIPKQFLKRTDRSGYGEFLFFNWRFLPDGSPDPGFVLNDPKYATSSILITGANFGCGSSREHAPWSLLDYGFRVIIASGFADIFFDNSLKNGLLPVSLPEPIVDELIKLSTSDEGLKLSVDLEDQIVSGAGLAVRFEIDPFRKESLLSGMDDIDFTLRHEAAISTFERDSMPIYRF